VWIVDTRGHWVGLINHRPEAVQDAWAHSPSDSEQKELDERTCNLRVRANGQVYAMRDIAAGEQLTFDYGIGYWVHRVTGWDWSWWQFYYLKHCQLFRTMHETVLDYTELLSLKLNDGLKKGEDGDPENDHDILAMLDRLKAGMQASQ